MNRSDSTSTTIASGTFRKNTARQLTCSTSQPPLTGPIAVVIALNARPGADRPAALGLVERGADDREAPRHEERGADALQRAAGDQDRAGDVAIPQRIDAAVKKMTPKRNTRLRPN